MWFVERIFKFKKKCQILKNIYALTYNNKIDEMPVLQEFMRTFTGVINS